MLKPKAVATVTSNDQTAIETYNGILTSGERPKLLPLPTRGGSQPAPLIKTELNIPKVKREGTIQARYIYPAPGVLGMKHSAVNSTLVTVYCPMTFEIFQIRTNQIMTVTEFKRKIAQKYETTLDNIIISYGDKEFKGNSTNISAV